MLIFLRTDCPISNSYAPEIARIEEQFNPKGVGFWLVYPEPDETTDDIRRQVHDYQLPGKILRDAHHDLVRRSLASATPEAALFNKDGKLVYHGRIDDRFASFGMKREEPTRHDLTEALDSVIAGQPVAAHQAEAIGCTIPPML